jgi:glycerol kinase
VLDVVLAVDQGSSSTKVLAVDLQGRTVARSSVPVSETHPRPGWVEQDPDELRSSVLQAIVGCLAQLDSPRVLAAGLSNQRESVVLWDRADGRPVAPLLSWQDSRATALAARVADSGSSSRIEEVSGLPLDPMFSAAKIAWLLDEYDSDRSRSRRGDLCVGTVDSWLTSTAAEHVVETGNASRTQLLDVRGGVWADELLDAFDIPSAVLPEIRPSAGRFPAAWTVAAREIPVTAVLGDSHAALFGHGVRRPGTVKATYGTGSSLMTLVDEVAASRAGLCLTIAWQREGRPQLALEGNIRASGAAIAWTARLCGISPQQVADIADHSSSDGVHLVPGFTGLGAPWWDAGTTGLLDGLTLGSTREQVCRAAVEAVAFQVMDLVDAARRAGAAPVALRADGGASVNDTLMQLQADLAGVTVERSATADVSALGAAHLAGIAAGAWDDRQLASRADNDHTFTPVMSPDERASRRDRWHAAVARARYRPPA